MPRRNYPEGNIPAETSFPGEITRSFAPCLPSPRLRSRGEKIPAALLRNGGSSTWSVWVSADAASVSVAFPTTAVSAERTQYDSFIDWTQNGLTIPRIHKELLHWFRVRFQSAVASL